MSIFGPSLNAVTTTGVGQEFHFHKPLTFAGMQVTWTGGDGTTSPVVNLEISVDGITFFHVPAGSLTNQLTNGSVYAVQFISSNFQIFLPFIAMRANYVQNLGTPPTSLSAFMTAA